MSQATYFVFSTPGVVCAMAVAAACILLRPRSAVPRRVLAVVALAYLFASVYAVPVAVSTLLARPYHRFEKTDVPRGHIALVVLGAGNENVAGWNGRLTLTNPVGAARVFEAWRVYGLAHPEWIISSGGNPDPVDDSEPSSVTMRNMLVELGVPASRIVVESSSRETHENALRSATILRTLHVDGVILVTSAVHMRRAIGAINATGVSAVPAVAPDSWFQNGWHDWLTPSNHALYFSGEVVHELLGLPYYQIRGWIR